MSTIKLYIIKHFIILTDIHYPCKNPFRKEPECSIIYPPRGQSWATGSLWQLVLSPHYLCCCSVGGSVGVSAVQWLSCSPQLGLNITSYGGSRVHRVSKVSKRLGTIVDYGSIQPVALCFIEEPTKDLSR